MQAGVDNDTSSLALAAFAHAAEGMLVVDPAAVRILEANDAALQLLGCTRREALTMDPRGLQRDTRSPVDLPQFLEQTVAAHPQALTTLLRRKHPDGSTIYLHGTLKAAQVDGRWLVVINVRDVTAEREIRLRVQRFTRAFDLSSDAVLLIDCESVEIADLNETACRMTGYSRDELLRLEPHRLTAGVQDAQALRDVLNEMIEQSPQIEMREFRFVRKDGGVVDAEAQCVALQSGGRWIVVATIRDISQRKAAQTRLEQFRLALDQSQDSLTLIDRETMRFVYVNQEAARRAGMTREECLRLTPWHTLVDVTGDILARFFDRVISRAPQSLVRRSQYRRWDGTLYPGESLVTAVQVDGRWLILVSTRDVSEREATLRRLERFRAAMEQAGSAIALIDLESVQYLDVNQTTGDMFGYPRDELLRLGPAGVERHGDADELRRRYAALVEKPGRVELEEASFTRADGSSFHAEASTRLMRSGDSWVVIRVVRDVTERQRNRAELELRMQELQRSNEELERFGYVASHDLSEPLRTMGSYAQLLQRRYDHLLDADGREFIGFMTDASQRMKQMLDGLFTYSRAGRTAAPSRPVNLQAVVEEVCQNLGRLIADKGGRIEAHGLPTVFADRASLIQVLQNLMANGLKFCAPGRAPVVSVDCVEDASNWTISVADNGIGIEPRFFERAFVVFQRLHRRDQYEGSGIGLAVCKKIVESHGGRIWIESEPGAGTVFRFTLPRPAS